MPSLVIRPTILDYGINREAYEDFVSALERDGFDVRLDRPPERRDRGFQPASAEVAIYLSENTDNLGGAVHAVAQTARSALRRGGGGRRAAILRPNGELLKAVDLDDY